MSVIEVNDLHKAFGKTKALNGVNLTINKGEILGLVGPNGAGKTTFMSCMLGIITPSSGAISIEGTPPNAMKIHEVVGFVPERLNFINWMTGYEFVHLHGQLCSIPDKELNNKVEEVLKLVDLEPKAWKRKIKGYSRGMLQRVGMAQALIGNPRYLFLDEPTSGLDPDGVLLFRKLLKALKSNGCTMVINSHQLEQLERVCDRIVFIRDGQIRLDEQIDKINADIIELQIRWSSQYAEKCTKEKLVDLSNTVGAELVEFESPVACFKVDSDKTSTRLTQALSNADLPIAEAIPLNRRLENLFNSQNSTAESFSSKDNVQSANDGEDKE